MWVRAEDRTTSIPPNIGPLSSPVQSPSPTDPSPVEAEAGRLLRIQPLCAWGDPPARVADVSWALRLQVRFLVLLGVGSAAAFLGWYATEVRPGDGWVYWPLTLVIAYKIGICLYEWYLYWAIRPAAPAPRTYGPTVDVFTTWCPGEPRDMLVRSLKAMVAMRHAHRTHLCDEGDDPVLRAVCRWLGVVHFTRTVKQGAKAGNINNALRQTSGEICIILDPDHEPAPGFIDAVIDHFADPQVGFVQAVQAYHNQAESMVARGAAEQTYQLSGPMMLGMQHLGTVPAFGSNCAFRRAALDSIGGHAVGLAEDSHTAMRLHARGWKSVYVPEIHTRGLVPATMAAYYKQQMKWSCGTFDLLIQTYFRIFRGLSWAQRLQYLMNPFFYLGGFVTMLTLLVPIACLVFGGIAWRTPVETFLSWYVPFVALTLVIRQCAQRWLSEPSERGFHLVGGVLRVGTWWVHLSGMVCSLMRVKIPYIPTPKDEGAADSWRLALPNLVMAGLSLGAVAYGLSRDWTPYSLLMAGIATGNAILLTGVSVMGQQSTLLRLRAAASRFTSAWRVIGARPVAAAWRSGCEAVAQCRAGLLHVLRERAVIVIIGLALGVGAMQGADGFSIAAKATAGAATTKETGCFRLGLYIPEHDLGRPHKNWAAIEDRLGVKFQTVVTYQKWGPDSLSYFPQRLLREVLRRDAVPLIVWEPWTDQFSFARHDPDLGRNKRVFQAITSGVFDDYIRAYALRLRDLDGPVLVNFAHEVGNPRFPWSATGENTPAEFIAAWRHIVAMFNRAGASNVSWIFHAHTPEGVGTYYPGDTYVDWVGITLLNYGLAQQPMPPAEIGQWTDLPSLYQAYRPALLRTGKPVVVTEFGSTQYGGDQLAWIDEALRTVAGSYPEVRALNFFHSDLDRQWPATWRPPGNPHYIDWTFALRDTGRSPVVAALAAPPFACQNRAAMPAHARFDAEDDDRPLAQRAGYASPHVRGDAGQFELLVDGKPFQVRGVAYGAGHDWRDPDLVPSRRQLEADFTAIRAMGANTVRRYGTSWYDRNILTLAQEHELKVLFGFWFEHHVDYLADTATLARYEDEVVQTVLRYRDHPAVLGWGLGNETWGLLKHRFAEPYLTEVRQAYVAFVERLARRVHEIDPRHPAFTTAEHTTQLAGELQAWHRHAPSLDFIAVNSYYDANIRDLDALNRTYSPERPYLVSEFGPLGYWDPGLTPTDATGNLVEPSDWAKARRYSDQWHTVIAAMNGSNIGGVAYSWRDRLEGTMTWLGLTDMSGRKKIAYFELRRAWTGTPVPATLTTLAGISGPAGTHRPGTTLEFAADELWGPPNGLSLEWTLRDDSEFHRSGRLRAAGNGRQVRVTTPRAPGRYRLYLHARDDGDGVATASVPIQVTSH